MPLQAFADILVENLPDSQIGDILQFVSHGIVNGHCPICGEEEVPVDEHGNEIEGDDVSHADEWREQHSEDCIVTLIESTRIKKEK